jgi:predicted nucleotidyltransferase
MDLEAALTEEMRRAHGVHTLVLYGSLARGDATPESDVDVAGWGDVAETTRDARLWNGRWLDAFVHPTALLQKDPDAEMRKLLGARVLLDERGLARPLLARIEAFDRRGPPPLPETERRVRRAWAQKMLARVRRGDLEAHYRRHGLLFQLLEDWFALRGRWYDGPKTSLRDLRDRDPAAHRAFERALDPAATLEDLAALVDLVVG